METKAAMTDEEMVRHVVAEWAYSGRSGSGQALELLVSAMTTAVRAQVKPLREIVRQIAAKPDDQYAEACEFCGESPDWVTYDPKIIPVKHTEDCPVTQARRALAHDGEGGE